MSLLNFKWSYRSVSFEYRKLFIRIEVSTSYYRGSHSNVVDVNGEFELHHDSHPNEMFFLMLKLRGGCISRALLSLPPNLRWSEEVSTHMPLNCFLDNYWFTNMFSSFQPLNDSNLIFLIFPMNLNLTRFEMINNAAVSNPLLLSAACLSGACGNLPRFS